MLSYFVRVSEEAGHAEGISSGGDGQVVGKLEGRANKTEIDSYHGGDRTTQTTGDQGARCGTADDTDSRGHCHIRAHQDTGQEEQPQ